MQPVLTCFLAPQVLEDDDLAMRARLLDTLLVLLAALFISVAVVFVITQQSASYTNQILSGIVGVLCLWLRAVARSGHVQLVSDVLIVLLTVTVICLPLNLGTLQSTLLAYCPVAMILATLLRGPRYGLVVLLTISISLLAFMWGETAGLFRPVRTITPLNQWMNLLFVLMFVFVILLLLHGGMTAALRQARVELTARRAAETSLAQLNETLEMRVRERTEELSAANAELSRATRLKDEFLAAMSHELRTPLNGVLGYTEALKLQMYGELSTGQLQALSAIEKSGQHLLALINDILDLAHIGAGNATLDLAPVSISHLCDESLDMVMPAVQEKGLHVKTSFDLQVDTLIADERRLRQILVNLLSNAVKFTPAGGSVGIDVTGDPAGRLVVFTVWDTGIGISTEYFERIFKPFVQVDGRIARQYGGTGLGLALVLRLVDMHGGSIELDSAPDQGSRFTVRLPWYPVVSADPRVEPAQVGVTPATGDVQPTGVLGVRRSGVVLVTDDNEITLDLLSHVLDSQGYTLVLARTGGEALDRARETRPDIILMDLQMPEVDGTEAIRRIRSDVALRDIPIIALTALAMPGDRERCLAAGADDYLAKPVKLGELCVTLERAHTLRAHA
ncbi:MAG: Autoinducer 2 sensor kinase/phosphatase LuxQ [Chloroflexota bacterium]